MIWLNFSRPYFPFKWYQETDFYRRYSFIHLVITVKFRKVSGLIKFWKRLWCCDHHLLWLHLSQVWLNFCSCNQDNPEMLLVFMVIRAASYQNSTNFSWLSNDLNIGSLRFQVVTFMQLYINCLEMYYKFDSECHHLAKKNLNNLALHV